MCPMTENGSTNTRGAYMAECPIAPYNDVVVIKPVSRFKQGRIKLPEDVQVRENIGIVMGCGGDVPNAEEIIGKKVLYAKFQHYEPYPFTNKEGVTENLIVLDYRSLMGHVRDDY